MNMSPAALRFGTLFSILAPASKLFANPSVGSAQDVKIDTVQPDQTITILGAQQVGYAPPDEERMARCKNAGPCHFAGPSCALHFVCWSTYAK